MVQGSCARLREPSAFVEVLAALLVAAGVFALSSWIEPPKTGAFSFGLTYQAMTPAPLGGIGMFPHRVLLPLLAWFLGLIGDDFHWVTHGTTVLFLAAVHLACRRWAASWVDAALITSAIGCSGAVQLYKTHVGYPDSLTFTLLLCSVLALRHGFWFWTTIALSAWNHEQVCFFVPVLCLLRHHVAAPRWRSEALALVIVFVAYALFRVWMRSKSTGLAIQPSYYWENGYFPLGFLGLSLLALVNVCLYFGPLLVPLAMAVREVGPGAMRRAFWLYVGTIFAILLVAHDVPRFVNFLFLPVLLASLRFLRSNRRRWCYAGLVVVLAAGYWLCNFPITAGLVAHMQACGCITGNAKDLPKLLTCAVPAAWPYFAGGAMLLAALWSLGWWLARPRALAAAGAVG